jgi:hypothetical protein
MVFTLLLRFKDVSGREHVHTPSRKQLSRNMKSELKPFLTKKEETYRQGRKEVSRQVHA